ncbi:membrane protein [Bacteroidia bacterium]|nr:membrane protein [Bacteroidia bacterium]
MLNFKRLNLIVGWAVGIAASAVYIASAESTVSFWDCGEFIACAYKLLVGHPPGAPFFLMLGRLFTMFSSPENVAFCVNVMSALLSGFTILFLFWSITHLAQKMFKANADGTYSGYQQIAILGAGLVGAFAYTFSDSFWFSAVEGEVYAMSSFFTAIVFWAMLKWENEVDKSYANRWIVLIAYLMGLSIGVHLLNLLAIPAMVFIYYFKKYKTTRKGLIYAALVAVAILAVTLYGIVPGSFLVGSWFELLFVNSFGLPFNTGLVTYAFLLFGALAYFIYRTHQQGRVLANTVVLCVTVILLGYGSYAMILIRSSANTSMDQNNPDNVFALMGYLNRDQYGDRPLVTGAYFNAPSPSGEEGAPMYAALNGRYEIVDYKQKLVYDKRFTTVFPRMFSSQGDHAQYYRTWNGGYTGRAIRITNNEGNQEVVKIPSFRDNLGFFFTYQLGFMYFRYFMWNFAGRQNDEQGHGDLIHGNWISGIPFIDNARLANQDNLPKSMSENKARNRYFMLPLLLGLLGMWAQYKRNKRDFSVVTLLFFFTGIAIVMYLNQTPLQPRERDYAYVGSFYAFAIWIGLGVLAVVDFLKRIANPKVAATVATVASLGVPALMLQQNWDDHNRHGRTLARDWAYNYLQSCKNNAILFTYGDNDTFPLWYAQEVEGIRTDTRLMNLSYASAEWYIDQMQRRYYNSAPFPMSLTYDKIVGSRRAIVLTQDRLKEPLDIKRGMDFVVSDDPSTKGRSNYRGQEAISYFPSKTLRIPTNVENLRQINAGVFSDTPKVGKLATTQDSGYELLPHIDVQLPNYVYRSNLAIIDLLANFEWKRPIEWGVTVPGSYNLGLDKQFLNEGLTNLLTPFKLSQNNIQGGTTATDTLYEKVMNVYVFRNLNNPNIYYDETCTRMLVTYRNMFTQLIFALINEEKIDKAKAVTEKYFEVLGVPKLSYYYSGTYIVEALYQLGDKEKAQEVIDTLSADADDQLRYYRTLAGKGDVSQEQRIAMQTLMILEQSANRYEQPEQAQKLRGLIDMYQ